MSSKMFVATAARSNYRKALYGVHGQPGNWWLTIVDRGGSRDYHLKCDEDAAVLSAAMHEKFDDRDDSAPADDPIWNALRGIKLGFPDILNNDDPIVGALTATSFGVR